MATARRIGDVAERSEIAWHYRFAQGDIDRLLAGVSLNALGEAIGAACLRRHLESATVLDRFQVPSTTVKAIGERPRR